MISKWRKPDPPLLKANSDASLRDPGWWGLGAIIRNEEGLVMASATWKVEGFDNSETAEAFGTMKCYF
jgi:hypothetical protein